jgi:glutamate/aspartate transport system substrate-binding protein
MPLLRILLAAVAAFALAPPASADELYGTLKESGTITIGHNADSPPFSFIGADGKAQGYSRSSSCR